MTNSTSQITEPDAPRAIGHHAAPDGYDEALTTGADFIYFDEAGAGERPTPMEMAAVALREMAQLLYERPAAVATNTAALCAVLMPHCGREAHFAERFKVERAALSLAVHRFLDRFKMVASCTRSPDARKKMSQSRLRYLAKRNQEKGVITQ
jgi:hypothetical protein